MSDSKTGRMTAVQAALARAQRHAGTAAVAAVLTPLALAGLASPAQALVAQPPPRTDVTISASESTTAGVTTFTYNVLNNSPAPTRSSLDKFEIPEIAAGDFNLGSFSGPEGWTAVLEASPSLSGTSLKSGTMPGAYILVSTFAGSGISFGSSSMFSLTTTEAGTVSANFGVQVDAYMYASEGYTPTGTGYVDPPVPGGPAAPMGVPEPASMAILGGAVLLAGATRMRRKG